MMRELIILLLGSTILGSGWFVLFLAHGRYAKRHQWKQSFKYAVVGGMLFGSISTILALLACTAFPQKIGPNAAVVGWSFLSVQILGPMIAAAWIRLRCRVS